MFYITFLLVAFCGLTIGLVKEHFYIASHKTWDDAKNYCRQNYRDLSSITTVVENYVVMKAAGIPNPQGWIGLFKDTSYNWKWSDGQSKSFVFWKTFRPQSNWCAQTDDYQWKDNTCEDSLPFFCYRILVLVNETKTWDEAQEYCRTHYTGLASPASDSRVYLDNTEIRYSQVGTVWAGLHVFNGQWIWSDKAATENLVLNPSCPAPTYRCGARNFNTDLWEKRNCADKLHFFCY